MTPTAAASPVIPPEVQRFAAEKGIEKYLSAALEITGRVFAGAGLKLYLEQDWDYPEEWFIVFEVTLQGWDEERTWEADRQWYGELLECCPFPQNRMFDLRMRSAEDGCA